MSGPGLIVRRGGPDDARAIASIHVRAWQAAYRDIVPPAFLASLSVDDRETRWRHNLADAAGTVYVAEDAAGMAGWASVGACRDADATASTGELWALYVDPARWRAGVGRVLWASGQAHLVAAGCRDAVVWVLEANLLARRFYAAVGFAPPPEATKTIEIGGAPLREVRLRARLAPPR